MVTLISPSKNGKALIKYLISQQGHDGGERNVLVDGIGLAPSADASGYIKQFNTEWSNVKNTNHIVQMRHIIISPSDKEIPYNASNAVKFMELIKEYLKEYYEADRRKCLICIQQDAKGFIDPASGKLKKILHAHIAVSDADIYDYRGLPKELTSFKYLSKTFDEFVQDKYKIQIDMGRNLPERKYLNKELITEFEKDEEGKFYSWQDCIKDKILQCAHVSSSLQDYYDSLEKFGLSVEQKTKKDGEQYQTYYLHDISNISSKSKDKNGKIKTIAKKNQLPAMRSYRQKGFSIGDIEELIRNNSGCIDTAQPAPESEEDDAIQDHIASNKHNAIPSCGKTTRIVDRRKNAIRKELQAIQKSIEVAKTITVRIDGSNKEQENTQNRVDELEKIISIPKHKQQDKSK